MSRSRAKAMPARCTRLWVKLESPADGPKRRNSLGRESSKFDYDAIANYRRAPGNCPRAEKKCASRPLRTGSTDTGWIFENNWVQRLKPSPLPVFTVRRSMSSGSPRGYVPRSTRGYQPNASVVFLGVVDGVFGNFYSQILVGQYRLAGQP